MSACFSFIFKNPSFYRLKQGQTVRLVTDDRIQCHEANFSVIFASMKRMFSDKKKAVKPVNDGPKIKQSKVKKKDKSKKVDESARSRELNLVLAALDAPMRKEPPISDEEKARRFEIGRNYNIGRFRFHNEIHQDLTFKIHLKKHAINMLPRNSKLKEEALKENDECPPAWRRIPVWTPPIAGFDPSLYFDKHDDKY